MNSKGTKKETNEEEGKKENPQKKSTEMTKRHTNNHGHQMTSFGV
jgi:hypothetical protein